MRSRRKAIATAIVVGLATTLAPTVIARAADNGDVQDLRRQIGQLRAEVQALQVALLADATALERQRSVKLTKALDESAAPAESGEPAPAAAAPPVPAAPTAPAASGESKARKAAHHRHHRRSSRARSRDR